MSSCFLSVVSLFFPVSSLSRRGCEEDLGDANDFRFLIVSFFLFTFLFVLLVMSRLNLVFKHVGGKEGIREKGKEAYEKSMVNLS